MGHSCETEKKLSTLVRVNMLNDTKTTSETKEFCNSLKSEISLYCSISLAKSRPLNMEVPLFNLNNRVT